MAVHHPTSRTRSEPLGMSKARFLREHWQRKPLLIRGAFPRFVDPLSPDELAGLACEDGVESRIVRERGGRVPWEITWGPQDPRVLRRMPEEGWTLLVQEVNRHVPEVALLLDSFSFVPNVRVDDVMVSFAAKGGSVGAHVDSYDVFLVQGQGERRWRYHSHRTKDVSFVPDLDLRILARFEPDVDEVLAPGDMLYLPPGFAHHGIAESPCLTYSIGFRSPSHGELWKEFAAWLANEPEANLLIADPPLVPTRDPGAIPPALLARVRATLRTMTQRQDRIDRFYAAFATRLKVGHELEPPPRPPREETVLSRLARGDRVTRSEEARWAHLPRGRGLYLYVGGHELAIPADRAATGLARFLCAARRFDGKLLLGRATSRNARDLIVRLFAMGALRFEGRAFSR
jgi:50S ribosomal protein L16 3-hydroxylase